MKSKNTTIKTKNIPNVKETNKIGLFKSFFNKSSSLTNKISANIGIKKKKKVSISYSFCKGLGLCNSCFGYLYLENTTHHLCLGLIENPFTYNLCVYLKIAFWLLPTKNIQ